MITLKKIFKKLCRVNNVVNNDNSLRQRDIVNESPLPTDRITFLFSNSTNLLDKEYIDFIAEELKIPSENVRNSLERIISEFKTDVSCCIEYPYVDMYYRDTYYSYFAKKHSDYNRYCFRISFFDKDITYENFHNIENLSKKFYGYIVLRPTKQRTIGYCFLSPQVYKENNFLCCLYKRTVSIYGRKLVVWGFPFCGQDGEMITCAETSLMLMLDYFSHKYSRYREILPSDIVKLLSNHTTERLLPSKGLNSEIMSQVLSSLGLDVRIYYRGEKNAAYSKKDFKKYLYTYIDSGFPIQVSTTNHSFLIIGREKKIGINNVKLVTIDDNERPYKLLDFNKEIISFSVPFYEKIYLEADVIDIKTVRDIWKDKFRDLETHIGARGYISRSFITSSRSYKEYISKMKVGKTGEHFLCISMPKFIWVYEIINKKEIQENNIKETLISSVFLFDATEGNDSSHNFIIAKIGDSVILKTTDETMYRKTIYKRFDKCEEKFTIFAGNLKGYCNKWQNF